MHEAVIVAISSVRNEAGIIDKTVSHHLADCDHVIISDGQSTDGTRDILAGFDRVTLLEQEGPFDQAVEILRLVRAAKDMGADWVVPFDADEFWVGLERLRDLPDEYGKVRATVFGHADWDRRHAGAKPLPKVCFRDARSVAWGNHDSDSDGWPATDFQIRELQYRDFDHFLAKIDKARELYESYDFPQAYGSHMRALVAMSDSQRVREWERLQAEPTVLDPIPFRGCA